MNCKLEPRTNQDFQEVLIFLTGPFQAEGKQTLIWVSTDIEVELHLSLWGSQIVSILFYFLKKL